MEKLTWGKLAKKMIDVDVEYKQNNIQNLM